MVKAKAISALCALTLAIGMFASMPVSADSNSNVYQISLNPATNTITETGTNHHVDYQTSSVTKTQIGTDSYGAPIYNRYFVCIENKTVLYDTMYDITNQYQRINDTQYRLYANYSDGTTYFIGYTSAIGSSVAIGSSLYVSTGRSDYPSVTKTVQAVKQSTYNYIQQSVYSDGTTITTNWMYISSTTTSISGYRSNGDPILQEVDKCSDGQTYTQTYNPVRYEYTCIYVNPNDPTQKQFYEYYCYGNFAATKIQNSSIITANYPVSVGQTYTVYA